MVGGHFATFHTGQVEHGFAVFDKWPKTALAFRDGLAFKIVLEPFQVLALESRFSNTEKKRTRWRSAPCVSSVQRF